MKVMVMEEQNEGLAKFMGQTVTLFCGVYIYTGKMVGINDTCVKLANPQIVYETGPFNENKWKDAQAVNSEFWYVTIQSIESFGFMK